MNSVFRSKLDNHQPLIGGWLTSASAIVAEALAVCGFDWAAVDMEHGPADEASIPAVFMALQMNGVVPFGRLPSADPFLARRMLDLGCGGLIVPVVESADDFDGFAQHCLYPPAGRRGVGLSRANGWGATFDSYLAEFQPVLVPQIETLKGAEAIGGIAESVHTDAVFIGPYDLSADMGVAGELEAPPYLEALGGIRDACAKAGKPVGIHQVAPEIEELKARIDEGYRLLAYGTDMIGMQHAFAGLTALKR